MPSPFTSPAPLTERPIAPLRSMAWMMKPSLPSPPAFGVSLRSGNSGGKPVVRPNTTYALSRRRLRTAGEVRADEQIVDAVAVHVACAAHGAPGVVGLRNALEDEACAAVATRARTQAAQLEDWRKTRCAPEYDVAFTGVGAVRDIGIVRADEEVIDPVTVHIASAAEGTTCVIEFVYAVYDETLRSSAGEKGCQRNNRREGPGWSAEYDVALARRKPPLGIAFQSTNQHVGESVAVNVTGATDTPGIVERIDSGEDDPRTAVSALRGIQISEFDHGREEARSVQIVRACSYRDRRHDTKTQSGQAIV